MQVRSWVRKAPGGGMAACSRVLAWEIPRTEEPDRGPQSTGTQRVGSQLSMRGALERGMNEMEKRNRT